MSDYNNKIEELKKELRTASNLCQVGKKTKKKYGLNETTKPKYQPAKIIECRQNVIELRKLISECSKLEKAKKLSLSQLNRERIVFESEFSLILGEEKEPCLQESFQMEPAGFRFKANGDIKKAKRYGITNVAQCVNNRENMKRNIRQDEGSKEGPVKHCIESPADKLDLDLIHRVTKENARAWSKPMHYPQYDDKKKEDRLTRDTDCIIGTVNVTKAIEETEKALGEIHDNKEIKLLKAKSEGLTSSSTFLRALSKDNQYSGGPYAVKRRYEMTKILAANFEDEEEIKSRKGHRHERKKLKSNCPACACKLRGQKDDFIDKKLKQLKKPIKRWNAISRNPSRDAVYSSAQAVTSVIHAPRYESSPNSAIRIKRQTGPSPRKSTEKKAKKLATASNISKLETKQKESVLHTKSTVDVDQWFKNEIVSDRYDDVRQSGDDLTPTSKARLTRIARQLLQHVPYPESKSTARLTKISDGVFSKCQAKEIPRYTEPLYDKLMERNSVSDKCSLEMLDEDDYQADFLSKHLENVEMLVRGMKLDKDEGEKKRSSFDQTDKGLNDKEQMFKTSKQNITCNNRYRKSFVNVRKTSSSALKAMKEMAEIDRKASESKIGDFIKKLPPPPVSIERWRSHDGGNHSVFEVYAKVPVGGEVSVQTGRRTVGMVGERADRHSNQKEIDLDCEKDPFIVDPNLLLQELDDCNLLPKTGYN